MKEIYLQSHDGADKVRLRIDLNSSDFKPHVFTRADCVISGLAYDRLEVAVGEPISDRITCDYDIRLPQIVINGDLLLRISEAISKWKNDYEPFEITMSNANEQKMTFSLKVLKDFICSRDRPVAVVKYSVHRLAIESRFIVDTFTITEFENEVNQILNSKI